MMSADEGRGKGVGDRNKACLVGFNVVKGSKKLRDDDENKRTCCLSLGKGQVLSRVVCCSDTQNVLLELFCVLAAEE